jgi:hypothetical protein
VAWSTVSPPETMTWAILLVPIMIGERLATTLSGRSRHLARPRLHPAPRRRRPRADHGRRPAPSMSCSPARRAESTNQVPHCESTRTIAVIGSQLVIVSLSHTDDNLGRSARLDRDRGAVGHNAQRRLHAIQTVSQLSYSPTVSCSIRVACCTKWESSTVETAEPPVRILATALGGPASNGRTSVSSGRTLTEPSQRRG